MGKPRFPKLKIWVFIECRKCLVFGILIMFLFNFADKAVVNLDFLLTLAVLCFCCFVNDDFFNQRIQKLCGQLCRVCVLFNESYPLFSVVFRLLYFVQFLFELFNFIIKLALFGLELLRQHTAPKHTEDTPKSARYEKSGIRFVVDLENCIKAQQSRSYAQKVKITNLQQMAHTYAFVKSHGFASIEELETALNEAKAKASAARTKLKATESRLDEVNKQIRLTGQFFANKDVYTEYRQSKKSEEFYEKHRAEITLYETARDNLRAMSGGQKLPSMKSLKEEKEQLVTAKNAEYEAYQNARTEQRDLQTVYTNVRKMLGMDDEHRSKRNTNIEID